jgi:hypothetical protein
MSATTAIKAMEAVEREDEGIVYCCKEERC